MQNTSFSTFEPSKPTQPDHESQASRPSSGGSYDIEQPPLVPQSKSQTQLPPDLSLYRLDERTAAKENDFLQRQFRSKRERAPEQLQDTAALTEPSQAGNTTVTYNRDTGYRLAPPPPPPDPYQDLGSNFILQKLTELQLDITEKFDQQAKTKAEARKAINLKHKHAVEQKEA